METIRACSADYDYIIDKIYTLCLLEESKAKDNVTRGAEVKDMMRLDKHTISVLEKAKLEFSICPNKCRDLLIQEKIIDYSALHFSKVLYTQPFGLMTKSKYLFDTKDEFALGVRE